MKETENNEGKNQLKYGKTWECDTWHLSLGKYLGKFQHATIFKS
jgi:hypothetical protein